MRLFETLFMAIALCGNALMCDAFACPSILAAPARGVAAAASCRTQRVLPALRMKDDMWKRIGNLAKDKVSGGKGWVDQGASSNSDLNVRGAGAGIVIGVCCFCPS